jgi:hypothetical protein
VQGYQTGTLNIKIKPIITFLGFIRFDAGGRTTTFPCPQEVLDILQLAKSALDAVLSK